MTDLFEEKAHDWDTRPIPVQISEGVARALAEHVKLDDQMTVMDFGAGTGLICSRVAPAVGRIIAVDVSRAMLAKLAEKPEMVGKVETVCQDIVERPLGRQVDLIVSAMAMHHVADTRALFEAFAAHLVPGGRIALADLDTEDGDFHPPDAEGVFHAGFDRDALGAIAEAAGFRDVRFVTAAEVDREGKTYPIFLLTAAKAR
ncbi:MAG: methyltransferase domain-containing protein [Myxococcales bacterium]|nr:methyltransferase domain-containing protein [Myxococcales bacterium]